MESEKIFRVRASLINRLVDSEPETRHERGDRPLRTFDWEELKKSVRRNLEWILSTRSSLPSRMFDEKELTVIDFGIPDFGSYYTDSTEDQRNLGKRLKKIIGTLEPRFSKIDVRIEPHVSREKTERKLKVFIDAVIAVENIREPISFVTIFNDKEGKAIIREVGE